MLDKIFLKQAAKNIGFDLDQITLDKMDRYAELLVDWNSRVNLTAILEPREIIIKHFIDSLLLLNHIELHTASIIDVGTGAGFPSLPCKLVRPGLQLTLLDSLNKRINFLNAVCTELGVEAKSVHGRAEEQGQLAEFREQFDIATARAVAHLRELAEYCLPFVKVGGYFIALKGYEIEQELEEADNAIKLLGGIVDDVAKYELEDGSKRAIVVIKKTRHTSSEYPRNKGRMTKRPL